MARPPLAIGAGFQQPIDKTLVSVRRVVSKKFIHLLWRRRQTGQVQVGAPQQNSFRRFWREFEFFLPQFLQQKSVDCPSPPIACLPLWNRRSTDRLKGPE